jgi:hypothetical protein
VSAHIDVEATYERLREASKVDWPTGSTPCPTVLHVAGYRPTALQTLGARGEPMNRVSAADVLLLLHQEADKRGDDRFRLKPATLRKWVQRGHITRGDGGYDLKEILNYLDRRESRCT